MASGRWQPRESAAVTFRRANHASAGGETVDTDTLLKLSTIVYNSTVALLSFGAVVAYIRARREKAIQEKHDFLSLTERYMRIQEAIINTEGLNDLNLSIYRNKITPDQVVVDGSFRIDDSFRTDDSLTIDGSFRIDGSLGIDDSFSKELALCGMMFQLMEDVYLTHELPNTKIIRYIRVGSSCSTTGCALSSCLKNGT